MGGLTNIEWENGQAEISLIIDPKLHNKGHGEQAVQLLLEQAFDYLRLEVVYGECYECNPAIEFWKKMCKKYPSNVQWLNKGKFWNGRRYSTMYFDFHKARMYDRKSNSVI
jgi:hypothetical protein